MGSLGIPQEFLQYLSDNGKRLSLASKGLIEVPDWLGSLTALTQLDLGGNKLTEVPDWLGNLTALTQLDLGGNKLTEVPDSLGNLTALTQLDLGGNKLTEVPDSLRNLTALTQLILGRRQVFRLPNPLGNVTVADNPGILSNKLTEVPDSLRNLTALKRLILTGNQLTEVPDWLGNLTALTELDLSGNQLNVLPDRLGNPTALTQLDLAKNQLTEVSDGLGNLTALTHLNLSGNQLTEVPDSLRNLTALTQLNLSGNQLTEVPDSLRNLTALTQLNLDRNQLTEVPDWLGNLTALTQLMLFDNKLTELPDSLRNLTALIELNLGRNQLTEVPDWLGNLTALTQLMLHDNKLTELPDWLGNLTALGWLALGQNQLTEVPDSLGNLTALTGLNLGDNQLTEVPDSLGNLTALTQLYLNGNQLTEVPDSLGNLTALTQLNLNGNQLTEVPDSLGNLTALTQLDLSGNQLTAVPSQLADLLTGGLQLKLSGNPLGDPLPELVERGANELATYLRSLSDAIAQYEAKLLLVGEGNVGKTSLVAALKGAPFVEGRPTTHGIEITPITFPHPALGLDMTLRTWDFGGQEVYRVSHQFFFSRRALYVVVWHARQGQEQDEVEGWLRRIQLRVGHDARTMVVATHCAERLPELDYTHLKQTFSGLLAGSFEVDSRTGVGLSELREAIGVQAARLPQMGQRISPRWVSAREEILARAEAEPQIRYEQFAGICERHGVTGPEISTLAKLMHDLGQVIYYAEDEGLKDIVVLNPEWLTKAISYVLNDAPTREAGGVLDHARLREIWHERQDGYALRYHPYFLRLMEKFDISYRLDGDELHSLVAQLVPHERPGLPWKPGTQPPAGIRTLTLLCRLSEPAPGLISWLTVRHNRASTGAHWRRGVFLRHPIAAYASEALLELRSNTELAVEVRAPSPDLYFNVLRDSIEDLIIRRWPGLAYRLLIPCPGKTVSGPPCPGQFPLDGLLRVREGGQTSTVACMDCGQLHEIPILLTGFAMPGTPLADDLDQMHDQLAEIKTSITGIQGQAAEIADTVRRVQRVVSTEVTDCPRLFTLAKTLPTPGRRARFYQHHYQLTLWCEHPGYWHPCDSATYDLDPPKEWFAQISPYVALVFRTLQLIVPLAGSIAVASQPQDQLEKARAHLEVMSTLVADLPGNLERRLSEGGIGEAAGELTAAEGQALRALRAILFEHDQLRAFGGMRRVQAPSGDLLWVCADHYLEYDPGLPTVPYVPNLYSP